MTITQLQYVLAVAEYQNFTLAAEKSFVTQPTLSMQVQKLEDELDVLIFSGANDIIINTMGTEEALRLMDWSGTRQAADGQPVNSHHNAWAHAPRSLWVYNDYPAGYIKSYKNLQFVTVYNAGR